VKYKKLKESTQQIFEMISSSEENDKFNERIKLIFNLLPEKNEKFLKEMFIYRQNKWCGYSKANFYKIANTSMAQFNKYARKLLH
jgi:hypothetical protein